MEQLQQIVERLLRCSGEEVLHIGDKAVVIAPASSADVDRITSGRIWD